MAISSHPRILEGRLEHKAVPVFTGLETFILIHSVSLHIYSCYNTVLQLKHFFSLPGSPTKFGIIDNDLTASQFVLLLLYKTGSHEP